MVFDFDEYLLKTLPHDLAARCGHRRKKTKRPRLRAAKREQMSTASTKLKIETVQCSPISKTIVGRALSGLIARQEKKCGRAEASWLLRSVTG